LAPNREEHNRVITRAVITVIVGVAVAYSLYVVREVLLSLYIAGLLAVGLSPVVRKIERHKLLSGRYRVPRWLAILVLYVTFLLAVAFVLSLVIPPLVRQIRELVGNLPQYADRLQAELTRRGLVDANWSWSSLFQDMQMPSGVAISGIFGALSGAVGALGKIVTVLLLPFYLLLEASALRTWLLQFVQADHRKRVDRIARAVTVKVGAWLNGQLVLGAVIGTTATVGLWLLGVPYFYVLGLIAAVGELIPVVGPILAAIPAILLAFTVSPQTALFVTLFCWGQQFVENNVLVPRIMERQVGVSPVAIITALLVGSSLLGFIGAILAVPSVAIIQVLVNEFLLPDDEETET
jgi:predicted PurR-regulated permease PerM